MEELLHLDSEGADGLSAHGMRVARRLIEENPLLFNDPIFQIDPPSGEIFPNSYCELTISFRPQTAGEIALTAYCELTGRESRLPLQLKGLGLGPKATWLYESLDIGDVYVNSEHRYEVVLENHGDIDCDYSLAPNDSRDDGLGSASPSHRMRAISNRASSSSSRCAFCSSSSTTTTAAAPPTSPPFLSSHTPFFPA